MRIYLIGLPSSGKSNVGEKLAEKLKFKFYDINHLIEKEALMFLNEISENLGEDTIRYQEQEILKKLNNEDNIVIALNSYFVTNKKNKKLLDGITFNIDTDVKIIEQRLVNTYRTYDIYNTPVEDISKRLFLHYLSFANHTVNNNREIEDTINEILTYINK